MSLLASTPLALCARAFRDAASLSLAQLEYCERTCDSSNFLISGYAIVLFSAALCILIGSFDDKDPSRAWRMVRRASSGAAVLALAGISFNLLLEMIFLKASLLETSLPLMAVCINLHDLFARNIVFAPEEEEHITLNLYVSNKGPRWRFRPI